MLESTLVPLLNKYLSSFIDNLNNDDLCLSLWSGLVRLQNIKVNLKFLEGLSLPIAFDEVSLKCLEISIPWKTLDKEQIRISVDGVRIVARFKERLEVSSKVSTTTNPSSDKPIEQKKSGGFEFDLMDFSELFPFGASLLNSIYVGVSNIEIVLTSDKYPTHSPFTLGLSLKTLELTSPIKEKSNSVGNLQVNLVDFSIFWNDLQASCKNYLLSNFCIHFDLILNLKRIEERRFSFMECVRQVNITDSSIQNQLLSLNPSASLSFEEFADVINQSVELPTTLCKELWITYHTPRPFISVDLTIGLIDCKITKKQYVSILNFVSGLSEWIVSSESSESTESTKSIESIESSNTTNSTSIQSTEIPTEHSEETTKNPSKKDHSSYSFSIITILLGFINIVFSSYSSFLCFIGCIFSIPYLLFHSFFHCLLYLCLLVLIFGLYSGCLYLYYKKLNKKTTKTSRMNELTIHVDFLFKGIHLTITNDELEQTQDLLTVGLEDLSCQCDLAEQGIQLQCILNDLFIHDPVTSHKRNHDYSLLNTEDVNDQGIQINKQHSPFINCLVMIQNPAFLLYDNQNNDIDVNVKMNSLNVILSPFLIEAILQFFLPLPLSLDSSTESTESTESIESIESIESTESIPSPTNEELIANETPSKVLRIGVQVQFKGVHVIVHTEKETALLHFGITSIQAAVSLVGSSISLHLGVGDLFLHDCTNGTSEYSEILCISHNKYSQFIDCSVSIQQDAITVQASLAAPILTIRMRFIRELLLFLTNSLLTECLQTVLTTFASSSTKQLPEVISQEEPVEIDLQEKQQNNSDDTKELTLPVLSIVLEDVIVNLPRSSFSSDCFSIHVGELSLSNTAESTTTLHITLQNLYMNTLLDNAFQLLIPGTSLTVLCSLGKTMDVSVHLSPFLLTLGEQQILGLLKIIVENLEETPVLYTQPIPISSSESSTEEEIENEIPCEESTQQVTKTKQQQQQSSESSSTPIHVSVCIDGIGIEYFTQKGGYSSFCTGSSILSNLASQPYSLLTLFFTQMNVELSMIQDILSLGFSLTSFHIQDSRIDSPLYSSYKSLLSLGNSKSPALAVLLKMSKQSLQSLQLDILPEGHLLDELISSIQISVFVGQLSIVPTPYIFAFLDQLFPFLQALLTEISSIDMSSLIPVIDFSCFDTQPKTTQSTPIIVEDNTEQPSSLMNIVVDAHLDCISLYCIEDSTKDTSAILSICLGFDVALTMNPLQDLILKAQLKDLRCCHCKNDLLIPQPVVTDAISPFNLNAAITIQQQFSDIAVEVDTSKLFLRLGVMDVQLLLKFIQNLLPKDFDPSHYSIDVKSNEIPAEENDSTSSEEIITDSTSSEEMTTNSTTQKEMKIQAKVVFKEIMIVGLNDSTGDDVPIIEFDLSDLSCNALIAQEMDIHCSLALHGNYYHTACSVWEPYLEPFTVDVSLKQSNEKMSVNLQLPQLMQLNVSSALILSILHAVDSIIQSTKNSLISLDNGYVSFVNYTGEKLQYCIDDDNGMNEFLHSSAIQYQSSLYQHHILYQNTILLSDSHQMAWLEIHHTSPYFIVYQSIPSIHHSTSILTQSDSIQHHDNNYSINMIHFQLLNQQEEFNMILSNLSSLSSAYPIPLSINEVTSIETTKKIDVLSQPIPSILPTHPSVSLLFLNEDYTVLPKRHASLFLNDFEAIHCNVDKEQELYLPFDKENEHIDTILRSGIIEGRKVVQLSSPISIQNCSNKSLFIRYVQLTEDYSTEYQEIQDKSISYCPLSFMKESVLHLSLEGDTHSYATIEMEKLKKSHLPSCINIGKSDAPFYVRLIITHKTVYDKYNKNSIDTICLRIVPVLCIKNMLPLSLDYRIVKGSSLLEEGVLKEGEITTFSLAPVNPLLERMNQAIRIRIRPEGSEIYSLFDDSILPSIQKDIQSATIFDHLNLPLRLSYNCFLSNQGIVTVELYCDYWIVNKTNMDLIVSEKKDNEASYRTIESSPVSIVHSTNYLIDEEHTIKPFLFSCSKTDPSNSLYFKCAKTNWSDKVGIGAVGTSGTIEMKPSSSSTNQQKIMLGISIVNAPNIFGLSKIVIVSPSIMLMNATEKPLEICQHNTSSILQLEPNQPISYQWTTVKEPLEICIRGNADMEWSEPIKLEVGETKLQYPKQSNEVMRINCVLSGDHLCVVFDYLDEFNKQLFFESQESSKSIEEILHLEDQERDNTLKMDINVNVKGLGISVIDNSPKEVLYVYIQDILAEVSMYQDQSIGISASITKLQIDNSIPGSKYPVMIGSLTAGESYTTEEGIEKIHQCMEVSVLLRNHPSFLHIDYCGFLLLPLQVAIDSATLVSLLTLLSDISLVTENWDTSTGHEVLTNCPSLMNEILFVNPPNESYCYCNELILQPISIKISMVNNPSAPLSADLLPSSPIFLPFRTLINTTLSLVANLQNASLQLNSFLMQTQYLSMSQLINKLVIHYVMQVISKIYLLLGAFNVVGNPVELVGNIYEGVSAFFFEPMESLMKKPSDFFSSVGKGTTKLLSMTAFGLLDSVSKITDTVSNGISSLSLSDSYKADRAAGKTGFIHGIKSGVTGLYKDTKKGQEEKGFVGAVTGFGSALTGLVINPLTGAVESVTHAVNSVKDYIHKEKELEPIRPSRYIPLNHFLLTYNYHLSYGSSLLTRIVHETSLELLPTEVYLGHCEVDDHSRIVLLTTNQLLVISMNCKLLWHDSYDHCSIQQDKQTLHIEGKTHLTNLVNELSSTLDVCTFEVESLEVATLLTSFITNRNTIPMEELSTFSLQLVDSLQPDQEIVRFPPAIESMVITKITYVGKTLMLAGESYNEDKKRKHIMYKVEVESESVKETAVWNVYFRYTNLELLHLSLQKRFNKAEMQNLYAVSQSSKMFHSKDNLEKTVIEYMKQLSNNSTLLRDSEVDKMFKYNAFHIHWKDENTPISS